MIASLLLNPFVAIATTAGVFTAIMLLTRPRPEATGHADSSAARTLVATARWFGVASGAATFAAFAFSTAAAFVSIWQPREYQWSRYPLPLAFGIVTLVVLIVVLNHRVTAPEAPVHPIQRRDWWTFSARPDLVVVLTVAVMSLLTCTIAGVSSDWMTISMPSGGGYSDFFGWAYGLPVLIGTLLMASLTVMALRANAHPPYTRPDTAGVEADARRIMATSITRAATAAILIPLGGALIFVGSAATGRTGVGIPGVGVFWSNLGFSSLAEPLIILGRVCEMFGVVLVFLLFVGGAREWRFPRRSPRLIPAPDAR